MKASSLGFLYIIFGAFFFFVGTSMLGISGTVEPSHEAYHAAIDPSTVLVIGGIADILMSLLFVGLTLHSFSTGLFRDKLQEHAFFDKPFTAEQ